MFLLVFTHCLIDVSTNVHYPLYFFFLRKLNNNTALLQKTITTNWNFALSIRSFTQRLT